MGRGWAIAATCAAAALAAGAATAQPLEAPTIACGESIDARVRGTHVVLDAVVLSPARELARPTRRAADGWSWFRPARIAVRDDVPDVALSVPAGWRHLVAISWGRGGAADAVRFGRCATGRGWTVYEGGFHLRRRGDCVPIVVRVGGTSTTVRLGLGRACGATRA